MGMFDDIKNKSDSNSISSEIRLKIKRLAIEKGISMQTAKEHYMKHGDQTE